MAENNNSLASQSSFRKFKPEAINETKKDPVKEQVQKLAPSDVPNQTEENLEQNTLNNIDNKLGRQVDLTITSTNNETNQLEKLTELNDVASKISDKLEALSTMLKQNVNPAELPQIETTSDALKDFVGPLPQVAPTPEPIVPILPESSKKQPSPVEKEEKKVNDTGDDKTKVDVSPGDGIKSILTKGFKSTVSVIDKVSNMLFKYSVTAAVGAAKFAAMLFAVILGIDLIKIHLKYWSDLFERSFEEFTNLIGPWGPLLDSIFNSIDKIKQMWEAGDWGGLAMAIVEGLGEVLKILVSSIGLALGKLGAAILRAFDANEKADALEGSSIQQYQQQTNAQLSKDDQEKLAKYQSKRIDEGKAASEGGFFSFLRPEERHKLGLLNDDEFKQIQAEKADNAKLKALPEQERVKTIMNINETSAALKRYENHIESADPNNPNSQKRLKQSYDDIKARLQDPAFDNAPQVKSELNAQLEALTKKLNNKGPDVKAEPSVDKPETKSVQTIQAQQKLYNKEPAKQSPATNINNTVYTSKRNINVQSPITSTTAPGVFGATKIN